MKNLRKHRKAAGITQAALAKLSGVNLRMVQKYENGEKDINAAQAVTVYRLANALDTSVENLLELDNKPATQG